MATTYKVIINNPVDALKQISKITAEEKVEIFLLQEKIDLINQYKASIVAKTKIYNALIDELIKMKEDLVLKIIIPDKM